MKVRKKQGKRKGRKLVIALAALAAVAGAAVYGQTKNQQASASKVESVRTAMVEKKDITSELSSSGVISPKNTYEITALVEGEVVAADFEEGDQVEEGQVLYQIDTSSMESELTAAGNSLSRAQENLKTAQEDYQEALGEYSGNTYKSTETGYIKTLYIKPGDKVSGNTKIADMYDDKKMKIKLPFLSGEAAEIGPGNGVTLTLTHSGEQLWGLVTAINAMDVTLTGGRIVRYVTIEVDNPGGLTTDMAATGQIGDYVCSMEGTFEPMLETVMNADISSSVEVGALLVNEGDYIAKGTPLFSIEARSAEKLLRTYKEAYDKAEESLESAKNKVESTQDSFDNYTVTAPISGQVITKNVKVGDKVAKSSGGSTTLAVIYDMSGYTFEMSVDELDVREVKVGQSVKVTADAVSGKTFSGIVTNVSLQSSYSNGVTNYPVTVTLSDGINELLPGMNVDGVIILDESKDTLAIPADALMRGDQVYVRDETVIESQGPVPAGFRAVEVKTGLISDDYVEITEGLQEGEEVYVAQSTVTTDWNSMAPGGMSGGPEGMPGGGPGGSSPGGGSGNPGSNRKGGNGGASR